MSRYLKSISPALLVICAAVISAVNTGSFNWPEVEVAVVGLVAATLAYFSVNGSTGLALYTKALTPALLTAVTVAVHAVVTGGWDPTETRGAVAGLLSAAVTFAIPNSPR